MAAELTEELPLLEGDFVPALGPRGRRAKIASSNSMLDMNCRLCLDEIK